MCAKSEIEGEFMAVSRIFVRYSERVATLNNIRVEMCCEFYAEVCLLFFFGTPVLHRFGCLFELNGKNGVFEFRVFFKYFSGVVNRVERLYIVDLFCWYSSPIKFWYFINLYIKCFESKIELIHISFYIALAPLININ